MHSACIASLPQCALSPRSLHHYALPCAKLRSLALVSRYTGDGMLQARPVYHRKRDSIEAHLTIVFAALAVSRWIEHRTGWSIRKFVNQIQAGDHVITAADPIPASRAASPLRQ